MAKIDGSDTSFLMNQTIYSQIKPDGAENKKTKNLRNNKTRSTEGADFTRMMDSLWGKTAEELGPLRDLPVSEESVIMLMDEVRSAGDDLINRPYPQEIMRYKQTVRNFINYVVKNNYAVGFEEGIPHFLKPGFKGKRGTPEAMEATVYTKINVIDNELEKLAAMLLTGQMDKLKLLSSLEEIRGLLIDLLQ